MVVSSPRDNILVHAQQLKTKLSEAHISMLGDQFRYYRNQLHHTVIHFYELDIKHHI